MSNSKTHFGNNYGNNSLNLGSNFGNTCATIDKDLQSGIEKIRNIDLYGLEVYSKRPRRWANKSKRDCCSLPLGTLVWFKMRISIRLWSFGIDREKTFGQAFSFIHISL